MRLSKLNGLRTKKFISLSCDHPEVGMQVGEWLYSMQGPGAFHLVALPTSSYLNLRTEQIQIIF